MPFAGSMTLWFAGVVLYLFFATALGIFLGTISRSMAQFALLIILVIVVLMLLSGGSTPVESQPKWLQYATYLLPARHFVSFSQIIIYRGGGLDAVWLHFLMVTAIGLVFFVYSLIAVPQVHRRDEVVAADDERSGGGRTLIRARRQARGSTKRSTAFAKPSSEYEVVTKSASRWTSGLALPIAMLSPPFSNMSTSFD